MDKILSELKAGIDQFLAEANGALIKLPPIEQFEATSEMAYGISSLKRSVKWLAETYANTQARFDEIKTKLQSAIDTKAAELAVTKAEELLSAKLSAGEYLKKADAEAAATSAADQREVNVRAEISTIVARRKEISTSTDAKVPALLTPELAASLPDEVLKKDDYKVLATKVAERASQVKALNVEAPSLMAEVATLPLDEAGDNAFNTRMTQMKEVSAKGANGKKPAAAGIAPLAAAALEKSGTETETETKNEILMA